MSVTGQIKGYVVGLDTKLCYCNSSDGPVEVVFRFPVDEGMAVVGLEAKIAGRTIKGVVSSYISVLSTISLVVIIGQGEGRSPCYIRRCHCFRINSSSWRGENQ